MGREQSVAPKERVNITYKPATGDAKEEIELPFRMLVLGDFNRRADETPLEERQKINVNKDNFDKVLKEQDVRLQATVSDVVSGEADAEIGVDISFESLKDFNPDRVAEKVPELKKLLDIRNALAALKGPLGNMRQFRKQLEETLQDPALVEKFMGVVSADDSAAASDAPAAPEPGADSPAETPSGDSDA